MKRVAPLALSHFILAPFQAQLCCWGQAALLCLWTHKSGLGLAHDKAGLGFALPQPPLAGHSDLDEIFLLILFPKAHKI